MKFELQDKTKADSILPTNKCFDDGEICIDWCITFDDDSMVKLPIYWNTTLNAKLLIAYEDYEIEEAIDMLYQWTEDQNEIED